MIQFFQIIRARLILLLIIGLLVFGTVKLFSQKYPNGTKLCAEPPPFLPVSSGIIYPDGVEEKIIWKGVVDEDTSLSLNRISGRIRFCYKDQKSTSTTSSSGCGFIRQSDIVDCSQVVKSNRGDYLTVKT